MRLEDGSELLHVTSSGCLSAMFGITQLFAVRVADPDFRQGVRKRPLRKSWSPRLREFADVQDLFNARFLETGEEISKRGSFIPDGVQNLHISPASLPCEMRTK
jgi:hypothetical protein